MIHRKTKGDAKKSDGEDISEPGNLKCIQQLLISNENNGLRSQQRKIQYWNDNAPLVVYAASSTTTFNAPAKKSALPSNLPEGIKVHIRSYDKGEYMIRFHNMDERNTAQFDFFDANNKTNYILTQFLDLNSSLSADVEELGLSTNQPKSEVLKHKFILREADDVNINVLLNDTDYSKLKFRPMEIRVFMLKNVKVVDGREATPYHEAVVRRNLEATAETKSPVAQLTRASSRHGNETNVQVYLDETNIPKLIEQAWNNTSDLKIIFFEIIFLLAITAILALILICKIKMSRSSEKANDGNVSQIEMKGDRKTTDDF